MTSEAPRKGRPGGGSGRAAFVDFLVCLAATGAWAARALPTFGTHLRDAYDAEFQAWEVAWVRHALVHSPGHLFDANIFAPERNTLAFTEPLIGYGVAGFPLGLAGLSEVGVFNVLCLLGTAFSVWAISRLAISHGAPRPAALLGAAAAALGAQTACSFGYISFVVAGGIALVLVGWNRLRDDGGWSVTLALGAGLACLGWFSLHIFAFALAALFAAVALDVVTRKEARGLALLARLAAALGLAALLLAPLARHMLDARRDHGFRRDEAESRLYSAAPRDWLATTTSNPGQAFLRWRSGSERSLYPGTAALLLGAVGILGWRRAKRNGYFVAAGVLLVALGIVGSFGPAGPVVPVLRFLIPFVFSGIRAFTRFGCVAQIGFGLLAAAGCSFLLERVPSPRAGVAVAAALAAGIAADVRQTVAFRFRPELAPPVEKYLVRSDTGGSILHLPLYLSPGDVRWIFSSLTHFKPIVNGYASYLPRRHQELAAAFAAETIPTGTLSLLAEWPVRTLVVHEHAVPLERRRPTMEFAAEGLRQGVLEGPRRFEHRGGDDWVFFLAASTPKIGVEDEDRKHFREHVESAPRLGAFEDTQFPASIDEPADGQVVHGELRVRGWSQTPGARAEIVEIRIDRDARARASFARTPRPDVAAALPALGDCSEAGYEARFPMLPGDDGAHDLRVVFRTADGRMRAIRLTFDWEP